MGRVKDESKKGWEAKLGWGFDAGNLSSSPNRQSCARAQHSVMRLKENLEAGKEGRAGWQSPGCCDVPKTGKDRNCGIQELQMGKNGQKSSTLR